MTKSVLIVDDNPIIRHEVCELFQSQGDFLVCGEAADGLEAIEKARRFNPDVIVMDLSMPGMNGLDAVRVLRRSMPAVPIIMFTAYDDALTKKEARSVGVSAVVSKYAHAAKLVDQARHLLYRAA